VPLRFLILYAYQLQGHQLIGAPDWTASERFDIVAKMEGDPPSIVTAGPDPMRLATQTLLADRRAVVDRTGLTGNWTFELTYAAEPSPDADAPSLFTAIQEELGLRLEPTTGPVHVLVVESVSALCVIRPATQSVDETIDRASNYEQHQ
jgi:Protein of unknown function (DUF3738)